MPTTCAIELDDRALALACEGRVLASSPSAVFDGSGPAAAGAPAWQALRREPAHVSTRHLHDLARSPQHAERAAALLAAQLSQLLEAHPAVAQSRISIAVPGHFEARSLGVVLAVARSLSLAVDAFIDAAVASVAALDVSRPALVLQLGLHHVAATAVEGGTQARRRRVVVSERGGLVELYEAWLDLISTAMVKRTRFDPLHDAATEQQLFDALPALLREAGVSGGTVATVSAGSERFDVPVSRDQFAQAGESIYREMLRLLHELRPAGAPVALLLPRAVAELPGLRESLDQFAGCDVVALADGFAAAAASMLDVPLRPADQTVPLLRRLPSQSRAECEPLAAREIPGRGNSSAPQASHLLFGGKAFSLSRGAVVVGRAPAAQNALVLPEGLAGVSRRHCTFIREAGEIMLVDHSRFGTFVNGERVAERVRVQAGDRVRVGDPGVELSMIAVSEAASDPHGPAPQS